ncbi:MAG: MaoC family dehydratase N-terminal domain-containing protein [Deltaproteobacteria bacterium]|nr:MaoC family dehydratase N-terminal domain-containing protein [Deltaproteobacteria bacterium]
MEESKLYYEDVAGDDILPSFQITVTRTHIVKYAGAGGDFFPVHHDEEFAKAVGLPSVFAMGLMHGGMLTRVVTDWAGDGRVRRYKIRFATMVWPGDTLTFAGHVVGKYEQDGAHLVDCELSVVNQNGEKAITGEATVKLPSRR